MTDPSCSSWSAKSSSKFVSYNNWETLVFLSGSAYLLKLSFLFSETYITVGYFPGTLSCFFVSVPFLSIFLSSLYNWNVGAAKGLSTLVAITDGVATECTVGTETVVGGKTLPGSTETILLANACSQTSYR